MVLFVTHDLEEALSLADRVLFLSPRPARVVLEQAVALPRPRGRDDAGVARLRSELLARHPEILAGRVGGTRSRACPEGRRAMHEPPRPARQGNHEK